LNYQIRRRTLPLAVYREVVAHLLLVDGVRAGLVTQQSTKFDYDQSQVDRLWLDYPEDLDPASQTQVQQILAYYGDRYGAWEPLP